MASSYHAGVPINAEGITRYSLKTAASQGLIWQAQRAEANSTSRLQRSVEPELIAREVAVVYWSKVGFPCPIF